MTKAIQVTAPAANTLEESGFDSDVARKILPLFSGFAVSRGPRAPGRQTAAGAMF
jgi:hypothetical protein